jgi:hypothetical protein
MCFLRPLSAAAYNDGGFRAKRRRWFARLCAVMCFDVPFMFF